MYGTVCPLWSEINIGSTSGLIAARFTRRCPSQVSRVVLRKRGWALEALGRHGLCRLLGAVHKTYAISVYARPGARTGSRFSFSPHVDSAMGVARQRPGQDTLGNKRAAWVRESPSIWYSFAGHIGHFYFAVAAGCHDRLVMSGPGAFRADVGNQRGMFNCKTRVVPPGLGGMWPGWRGELQRFLETMRTGPPGLAFSTAVVAAMGRQSAVEAGENAPCAAGNHGKSLNTRDVEGFYTWPDVYNVDSRWASSLRGLRRPSTSARW